jgi:hypothetical protein
VTPGERRPRRIKEDAISQPADPLPWWDEVRGKSAWKSALRGPGNEGIVHGRRERRLSVTYKVPQGDLDAQPTPKQTY